MTRPDEEGFYRTDRQTQEEPRDEPAKGIDWVVLVLVCSLMFAIGLVAGVLLSLVMLGCSIA